MNKEENFETMVKLTPLKTLDYISQLISDLYEERERLQDTIYKQEDKIEELRALYFSEREVKEDYKSKVNKAIEFLNDECSYDERMNYYCDDLWCGQVQELVNILKGVDKE